MIIKIYHPSQKKVWDEFVKLSKNYHFFFERDYLEYHSDRFKDHSLMFYNDKGILISLLPANLDNKTLYSHQGLTFGGLILKQSTKQKEVIDIFCSLNKYLQDNKFNSLIYKKIPYIYHSIPCDEDLYGLFKINAKLTRRDITSSIKVKEQIKYSKGRKWIVKKANQSNIHYGITNDIEQFWFNLNNVLTKGHGVTPVHSEKEISALQSKFTDNIKFFTASLHNKQLAGAVIFETKTVAHTQYLFNTEEGRELGALDGLIDFLIKNIYTDKEFFDFGISNENQGKYLNEGLISQKEGFGARAIAHDFYEIKPVDL